MSVTLARSGLLRFSPRDGVLVGLSFLYAGALLAAPSIGLIAIGLWWTSNTVAHNFIHTPFFRSPRLNAIYSVFLSAVTGVPQTLWRRRHLAHHAGRDWPIDRPRLLALEFAVVTGLWAAMAIVFPGMFLGVYVPGYALGLTLCFLQGHYEHARGTTSHYGWFYNLCFFNDGYHVEHHRRPGVHWTRLPATSDRAARHSRWPPVLRWLDAFSLDGLERVVLRSPRLQRIVLALHERAFRRALADLPPPATVTVVGGGLFPRTVILLRELLPDASITVVERCAEHIGIARRYLEGCDSAAQARFETAVFDPAHEVSTDLLVIPLGFDGDRQRLYDSPPAPLVLIHDWMWNRRDAGVPISWLLLKRLNLVRR